MQRDTVYLAGLLHDIGKFVERSKKYDYDEEFSHVGIGHAKHSGQLLAALTKEHKFLSAFSKDLGVNLV